MITAQLNADDLVAQIKAGALTPLEKLAIVEAMGFSRSGSNHTRDCAYALDRGNRCTCVPPPDVFDMPDDVARYTHQDWASRLEAAKRTRPIFESER